MKIITFIFLFAIFLGCNSSFTGKNNSVPPVSAPQQTNSTTFTADDTASCLRLAYSIIWNKSNYWQEFKKRSNHLLCGDIADSETITYLNNREGSRMMIEVSAGEDYVKKKKLNNRVDHMVSLVTIDLSNNSMWAVASKDSFPLKFDTTLVPLIRRKCFSKHTPE